MGLLPLEFSECLTDSPYFRENLHAHEKELERTSQAIKSLIKECKDVLSSARSLSKAQRNFSKNLMNFKFECIGSSQTDDEICIAKSLQEFGKLIDAIEDERDRMLERAYDQFVLPLETFRKEQIGGAKEGKKKFDKQTSKFCQSLERHLNLSTKKNENALQEADASLEMEQRHFYQASLEYIFLLQEVQERKKFEFVETLLGFMYGWLTFYHQGHEVAKDCKPFMTDLQMTLQRTRESFNGTREEAETLKKKMLEKPHDASISNKQYTRQGYLFLMEKKAFGTTTWTKFYCSYVKESRIFSMMPYTQTQGKVIHTSGDSFVLKSCVRRISESIEKRFCFDITAENRPLIVYTYQALSEQDRRLWMDAMDGKEPIYSQPGPNSTKGEETKTYNLDENGLSFIKKCIHVIETTGIEDQGIYRIAGVNSKVNKLIQMCLDRRKTDKVNLEDESEWEIKTITSALKNYFRSLPEPLMTFKLHYDFINAAKQESRTLRVNDIHSLVHQLSRPNFDMLEILIRHLCNVAAKADKNLMTVSNLGVCFGPTLLRPEEETMAAIMDIKFCNIVVEILIENCDKIFCTIPDGTDVLQKDVPVLAPRPAKPPNTSAPATPNLNTNFTPNHPSSVSAPATPITQAVHNQSSTVFSNNGSAHTVGRPRAQRPIAVFNPAVYEANQLSSSSSSSESISSRSSGQNHSYSSPQTSKKKHHSHSSSGHSFLRNKLGFNYPRPDQILARKRQSLDSIMSSSYPQSTSSSTSSLVPQPPQVRRVRTLYACEAENDSELSFEPNQIITNVRPSKEPGWLEGTLNGKTGLIPENYVESLP